MGGNRGDSRRLDVSLRSCCSGDDVNIVNSTPEEEAPKAPAQSSDLATTEKAAAAQASEAPSRPLRQEMGRVYPPLDEYTAVYALPASGPRTHLEMPSSEQLRDI
jgi:hypothetical protein